MALQDDSFCVFILVVRQAGVQADGQGWIKVSHMKGVCGRQHRCNALIIHTSTGRINPFLPGYIKHTGTIIRGPTLQPHKFSKMCTYCLYTHTQLMRISSKSFDFVCSFILPVSDQNKSFSFAFATCLWKYFWHSQHWSRADTHLQQLLHLQPFTNIQHFQTTMVKNAGLMKQPEKYL